MKRIKTTDITTGVAYPLTKNGFDFLQDSYKEAIASLAKTFLSSYAANTPYVLHGMVKSSLGGSNYAYTAGSVFYNGEVYDFDAIATIAIVTSDVCTITVTNDGTADPIEFTDGSTKNVHNIRKVTLADATAVTNGATQFNFSSCVFISDTWHYVGGVDALGTTFQNSWANEGSGTYFNLAFIKESVKFVSLRGRIQSGASGTTIFTLPTGYRPAKNTILPLVSRAAADYASVEILTSGAVSISYGGAATDWFLDGVRFSTSDY